MLAGLTAGLGRLLRTVAHGGEFKSAPAMISFEGFAGPSWGGRDFATLAREGFAANPVVYRSVRLVAESVSSVPLLIAVDGQTVDRHPLADLLSRPNETETGIDLLDAIVSSLLLSGEATLQAVAVGERIAALYVLRPDRVRAVAGSDGWPSGIEYQTAAGPRLLSGEVVAGVPRVTQIRLRHPLSDVAGLAPIEAAAASIEIHNMASRWNKALLDNSARPSGALVYSSPQTLTTEQFERLKRELEASFQSARNAGRPMLLEGGLDWKAMSMSPRDMDFIELKHVAAREIALAVGVPPILLGIPGDATYANYREANRSFWGHTAVPLLRRIAAGLSLWLAPGFGGAVAIVPDLDAVEALTGAREALWSRLDTATFLTLNEKRAALGYPPRPDGDRLAPG